MAFHQADQGETLADIADFYDLSVEELQPLNPEIGSGPLAEDTPVNLPEIDGETDDGMVVQSVIASPADDASRRGRGIPGSHGGKPGGGGYVQYHGSAAGFPKPSNWATYKYLWGHNSNLMNAHDTKKQIHDIHNSINKVARQSRVDVRVILCVIMQESGGNVHVHSTDNGVPNRGIMQSHNGVAFDPDHAKRSILRMVKDGTEGTRSGDGIQDLKRRYGNIYEALRGYNSGSVNPQDLNDPLGATASYVKDVANRLMGHVWPGM